jgi:DNA processing protein
MKSNEILAISLIKGVGPQSLRKFVKYITDNSFNFDMHYSTIEGYFSELSELDKRIKLPTVQDIKLAIEKSENISNDSINENIKTISYLEVDFPPLLRLLEDYPVLLHYKGNIHSLKEKCVAIIGTREVSDHAIQAGERLSKIMSEDKGYTIVSGLAVGCDTIAHRSAVEVNRPTAAFMAGGLDKIYPKENLKLSEQIIDTGGVLISEYEIGKESHKNFFVQRDRLQSGSSEGIIVLETGIKGGTRHTVSFAGKQNRIIGCLYTHVEKKLDNLEKFQGNKDIVENEGGFKIFNPESIDNFCKLLEDKRRLLLNESNNNDSKEFKSINGTLRQTKLF